MKLASFCVDHDHGSGKVRGLLCGRCNIILGMFADNISVIESMIHYLETYRADAGGTGEAQADPVSADEARNGQIVSECLEHERTI